MAGTWNFSKPLFEGDASRQAHADIPKGTFERELGRSGFSGAASHVYHRNPPTAWESLEGELLPRAFRPLSIAKPVNSPWSALDVLHNQHVRIRIWNADRSMDHLVRNSDGDDLIFIHRGSGDFFCDYGHFTVSVGDYVVIPRGTMWRLELNEPIEALLIESTGAQYRVPDRGIIGRHAPFDLGVLAHPELNDAFRSQPASEAWQLRVKRGNKLGAVNYRYNPLDAVGWKGDLYPVRLNIKDIRAITSYRVHLPPSIRTTFVSDRFVVCSITPRPLETDPGAMKLPFFHNNDDYDEVIFYHGGNMSSRGGTSRDGMLTLHPCGLTHGPHPEALPRMFDASYSFMEAYSVMIDTEDALNVGAAGSECEVPEYKDSWRRSMDFAPDAAKDVKASAAE